MAVPEGTAPHGHRTPERLGRGGCRTAASMYSSIVILILSTSHTKIRSISIVNEIAWRRNLKSGLIFNAFTILYILLPKKSCY